MPRSIQVVVPAHATDALSAQLLQEAGLLSLQVNRGISVKPVGDVISIEVLDRALPSVMSILVDHGLGADPSTSLTSSSPISIVSPSSTPAALSDTNESSLEEMEQILAREAPLTANVLFLMAISGVVATVGIAQGALHLVIGAMIIAPGFVPIVQAVFGAIMRRGQIRRGMVDTVGLYAALLAGAGVASVVLSLMGQSPAGTDPSYEPPLVSVTYWSTVTWEAAIVTLAAGVAGALLIATNRPVLTAGVMVALALVPSAALVPIAVVAADWPLAANAAARWFVDVALLVLSAGAVFVVKQRVVHHGRALT